MENCSIKNKTKTIQDMLVVLIGLLSSPNWGAFGPFEPGVRVYLFTNSFHSNFLGLLSQNFRAPEFLRKKLKFQFVTFQNTLDTSGLPAQFCNGKF